VIRGAKNEARKNSLPGLFLVEPTSTSALHGGGENFHVRYPSVLKKQHDDLVLVKGGRAALC
jgi:hypothetical protein